MLYNICPNSIMSFTLNSITEELERAYDFVPFGGGGTAYKIQCEDDGLGLFFELERNLEDAAYYSGGGRTNFYSTTIHNYSYEHLGFGFSAPGKESRYTSTYIVFNKYDVILIRRNNKGEEHTRITMRPSIKDNLENYEDFEDNHASAVSYFIRDLSRMNRRRVRSPIINLRLCLRKKMGLGR